MGSLSTMATIKSEYSGSPCVGGMTFEILDPAASNASADDVEFPLSPVLLEALAFPGLIGVGEAEVIGEVAIFPPPRPGSLKPCANTGTRAKVAMRSTKKSA
jgi:hypothetical protein